MTFNVKYFFSRCFEKTQSCTCGGAPPHQDGAGLITAPIDKTYRKPPIDRNKSLDICKKIIHTPPMKIKKKQLAKLAFRAYMIYSITADIIVISGIVYIIFF